MICPVDWRIMRKGFTATIRARITINGQQFTEYAPVLAANLKPFRTVAQAKMRVRLQEKINAHYGRECYFVNRVYKGVGDGI